MAAPVCLRILHSGSNKLLHGWCKQPSHHACRNRPIRIFSIIKQTVLLPKHKAEMGTRKLNVLICKVSNIPCDFRMLTSSLLKIWSLGFGVGGGSTCPCAPYRPAPASL